MCVILDTNTFSRFRDPNDENMEPVREWLRRKNGKIVYSNTEKFKKEWRKGGMEHWIKERTRASQFKLVTEGVQEKENELQRKNKIRRRTYYCLGSGDWGKSIGFLLRIQKRPKRRHRSV